MPEIMDGKNIADFIDPDIAEKLEALEREEEKLQAGGFYDSDEEMVLTLRSLPFLTTYSPLLFSSSTLMTNAKLPKPKLPFLIKSKHNLPKNPKRIKLGYHVQPVYEHLPNSPTHLRKPDWIPVESKNVQSVWLSSKLPSVNVREMATTTKWTWMVMVMKAMRLGKIVIRWILIVLKDLRLRKSKRTLVVLLQNGYQDLIVLWLGFEMES